MGEVVITVTEDGPYRVEGEFELVDQDGRPIEAGGPEVLLCRCGRSTDKPFCDGTHGRVGFKGACVARPLAGAR
jgi:CDGSH-type Zn-finger protein